MKSRQNKPDLDVTSLLLLDCFRSKNVWFLSVFCLLPQLGSCEGQEDLEHGEFRRHEKTKKIYLLQLIVLFILSLVYSSIPKYITTKTLSDAKV